MTSNSKAAEQAFYDEYYQAEELDSLNGFYVHSAGVKEYERRIYAVAQGRRILEYGCGVGSYALRLADRGGNVCGIDISTTAISRAQAAAGGRAEFRVEDAEHLSFADASFDVVCGTGILHHLDLDRSIAAIRRVLKPGGRAIFYEPIAHNPLVNLYRVLTPSQHTKDEHPLRMRDIERMRSFFEILDAKFFDVVSIAAIPVLGFAPGRALLRALEAGDRLLLDRVPAARPLAATVVLDATR